MSGHECQGGGEGAYTARGIMFYLKASNPNYRGSTIGKRFVPLLEPVENKKILIYPSQKEKKKKIIYCFSFFFVGFFC